MALAGTTVVILSKKVVEKSVKSQKFGVRAYVVNLIQLGTALAEASDHPQRWPPPFGKQIVWFR
jgi:hypothetical protein